MEDKLHGGNISSAEKWICFAKEEFSSLLSALIHIAIECGRLPYIFAEISFNITLLCWEQTRNLLNETGKADLTFMLSEQWSKCLIKGLSDGRY